MNAEYVSLSFFKSHNIDYHYKKPFVTFPCPSCCREAKMDVRNTSWHCTDCTDYGTLLTLIKIIEQDGPSKRVLTNLKVYNPNEEWILIKSRFETLIIKHGKPVEKLYEKVCQLIDYYQKERSK